MKAKFAARRILSQDTSVFSRMSGLALEYNAVNLGQGFPDFDGPQWVMQEAFEAMKKGKNQYAPMQGIYSLRKAVSAIQRKYYSLEWDAESEITICSGATEALFSAITGLIDEGDEVILFEPYYDSHQADVIIAGGKPVYITLRKPDFKFDYDELEKAISSKTKMIIINNPHNPTGKVYTDEEFRFIAGIAVENDLLVISDEVYEFLTFDSVRHIPIASYPGMKERTITISSTGKTYSMTGWKIGWAIASAEIIECIKAVHQWATFAVNTPGQHAMARALERIDDYLPEFRDMYQRKRDMIVAKLEETPFKPHIPFGSFFVMTDIPNGIWKDDVECAEELVKRYGVATIPPSVFYGKSDEGKTMLRLCFAKRDWTISKGIDRLKSVVV